MKIILYGKKGNAHTTAFKNYLKMTDITFNYKDVLNNEEANAHTKQLYDGSIKYPTLFIDQKIYLEPTSEEFSKIIKSL